MVEAESESETFSSALSDEVCTLLAAALLSIVKSVPPEASRPVSTFDEARLEDDDDDEDEVDSKDLSSVWAVGLGP